jgi:hypothetical protein
MGIKVGRMPMITSWAPMVFARGSASFERLSHRLFKGGEAGLGQPAGRDVDLDVETASSVWNDGSAIAARTSALRMAG